MAYTTIELISAELNGVVIDGTTVPSDTTVTNWIAETESEINQRTGKTWETVTVADEIVDYDGTGYVRFPKAPIVSITSIEYNEKPNNETPSWVTIDASEYIEYSADGEVKFVGNTQPSAGLQKLRLNYESGYDSVPGYIQRLATLSTAKRFIQSVVFADAKEQGGSVTVGNISISDPTAFGGSQIRDIDKEIEAIYGSRINSTHVYRPSRDYRSTIR